MFHLLVTCESEQKSPAMTTDSLTSTRNHLHLSCQFSDQSDYLGISQIQTESPSFLHEVVLVPNPLNLKYLTFREHFGLYHVKFVTDLVKLYMT